MPIERMSPFITAPEIRTERTILRAHRLEDFGPMLAMWQDEAVYRHILGRPSTGGETAGRGFSAISAIGQHSASAIG